MDESSPTRVLRKTLEDALETHLASTVLFEALGASGSRIPETLDDVLRIVNGPLRAALTERLDVDGANALVTRIVKQLEPPKSEPLTLELSLDNLAEETRRGEDATMAFPTASRAVGVLVLAAGGGFAYRLELALGERRVAPETVRGAPALKKALAGDPPAVLVLDGTDFPAIDHQVLVKAAEKLPATTACVLYGAELPYGKSFVKRLGPDQTRWVTLELREGVAPFLDLVRSRRKSTHR